MSLFLNYLLLFIFIIVLLCLLVQELFVSASKHQTMRMYTNFLLPQQLHNKAFTWPVICYLNKSLEEAMLILLQQPIARNFRLHDSSFNYYISVRNCLFLLFVAFCCFLMFLGTCLLTIQSSYSYSISFLICNSLFFLSLSLFLFLKCFCLLIISIKCDLFLVGVKNFCF